MADAGDAGAVLGGEIEAQDEELDEHPLPEMDEDTTAMVEALRVVEPGISVVEALRHIKLQRIVASRLELTKTPPGAAQQLSVPVGVKEPDYFTPGKISWAEFEPVLRNFLVSCGVPEELWGVRG